MQEQVRRDQALGKAYNSNVIHNDVVACTAPYYGKGDYVFIGINDLYDVNSDIDNLFEVNSELIDVAVRWRYIGLALHLKDPKLSIIQDNNADVTTRLTDMLRQWLNKTYDVEQFGQPSWQMLAETVRSPAGGDNPALAAKMARKHFVILA